LESHHGDDHKKDGLWFKVYEFEVYEFENANHVNEF
jgi:hypothetical protein